MDYSKKIFQEIFSPRVVGVPPSNCSKDLMRLPDGELRHYGGYLATDGRVPVPVTMRPRRATYTEKIRPVYISSRDNGLSWQEKPMPDGTPGAVFKSPESGRWLAVISTSCEETPWRSIPGQMTEPGTYVCASDDSVDGPFQARRICDDLDGLRTILYLHKHKRLLTCGYNKTNLVVLYSNDDGDSWEKVLLPQADPFPIRPPHQWPRPQSLGMEPTVVELSDGRLWMLFRTGDEYFYQCFSSDGGQSWSAPEPSRFPGSLVMPTFKKLSDGRIILFWCNAAVLPEPDQESLPETVEGMESGLSGYRMSNRDAFHVAISDDDGKTWRGFRELLLSPLRNDSDFRISGGNDLSPDKGLHQSQSVELPDNKMLVAVGQHERSRFLVIFDIDWLYETSRQDDLSHGLLDWSCQQYVHSIAGQNAGYGGHCAYNRRPGAQLVRPPDGPPKEALQIARHPDPRLIYEPQGAVWNFPAAISGKFSCRLRLNPGFKGARISLLDRWVSPVDPAVDHYAALLLNIDPSGRINGSLKAPLEQWFTLEVFWKNCHLEEGNACWKIAGNVSDNFPAQQARPNGISYVHFQSTAPGSDPNGLLVDLVEMSFADA